jgi:carboxyl-terminal processing protease
MTSRKTLSLNIEARRNEREQDLEHQLHRENERRAALGLEPVESLDDIEEDEIPDILLDQAAGIVTDLAQMREIDSAERTAAIRR